LEGESADVWLASLFRFLQEEEKDELSETRDQSDSPEAEPGDDDEVAGDKASNKGDSSVSVRTEKSSVQRLRIDDKIITP